jgi:excisionase family DNA binding protein
MSARTEPSQDSIRSNPPNYLTVREASVYIGICERSLREKISLQEIRVARIGSRVILRLKDVEAWIESRLS